MSAEPLRGHAVIGCRLDSLLGRTGLQILSRPFVRSPMRLKTCSLRADSGRIRTLASRSPTLWLVHQFKFGRRLQLTVVMIIAILAGCFGHRVDAATAKQVNFYWGGISWTVPQVLVFGPHPSEDKESFMVQAGWRNGGLVPCCDLTSGPLVRIIVHKGQLRSVNAVASRYSGAPKYPPVPIDKFRYSGSSASRDLYTYDRIRSAPRPLGIICPAVENNSSVETSAEECRIDIELSIKIYVVVFISASQRANGAVIADRVIDLLLSSMSKGN